VGGVLYFGILPSCEGVSYMWKISTEYMTISQTLAYFIDHFQTIHLSVDGIKCDLRAVGSQDTVTQRNGPTEPNRDWDRTRGVCTLCLYGNWWWSPAKISCILSAGNMVWSSQTLCWSHRMKSSTPQKAICWVLKGMTDVLCEIGKENVRTLVFSHVHCVQMMMYSSCMWLDTW